jgi:TolB-like protein
VLVQYDETLAHQRIQDSFRRFSETIEAYGGVTHEIRGDALVAEFDRASDAVCAGIAFQADNSQVNATLEDDVRPKVRIGISMGEVVIADKTVTGAGVVLAQRLEQLADPGGMCIQDAAYQSVPKRLPFEYESLGEQEVKGFEDPVRAYRVALKSGMPIPSPDLRSDTRETKPVWRRVAGAVVVLLIVVGGGFAWWQSWKPAFEPASVERMAFPLPDKPSIAVLPFTNISDDAQQEYFVDGMTDDLITDLSKLSGLFVIARNSVFSYKGQQTKVQQIAKDLGVRYILEGSVRRVGDNVRINAQLIDATTGGHLWAERYDGLIVDVFKLQDKVTSNIVAALKVVLTPQEQALVGDQDTSNIAAYDAFLRGWQHLLRKTPENAVKAIAFFKRALELDPNYSRAYAALAQAYWDNSLDREFNTLVGLDTGQDDTSFVADTIAWKYLQKVRGKSLSQIHALSARMLQRQRRFDQAMQEARRAIALGPNDPSAYDALIENLIYSGSAQEAINLVDESIRLDPNLPSEKLFLKGMAYYTMGRLQAALSSLERARTHNPQQTKYAAIQAVVLAELDRIEEAEAALKEYLAGLLTYTTLNWTMFYWPFQERESAERMADGLLKAGLRASPEPYYFVAEQDRLTGDQIISLVSNRTMVGVDRGPTGLEDELEVSRDQDAQIIRQEFLTYFRDGTTRIENNLLCDPWWEFGDYCVAIYRNNNGTSDARDEYIFFTLASTFTFSVFDSTN